MWVDYAGKLPTALENDALVLADRGHGGFRLRLPEDFDLGRELESKIALFWDPMPWERRILLPVGLLLVAVGANLAAAGGVRGVGPGPVRPASMPRPTAASAAQPRQRLDRGLAASRRGNYRGGGSRDRSDCANRIPRRRIWKTSRSSASITRPPPNRSVSVILEGEIDIYSAPEFKEVLVNGIEGGAKRGDRRPFRGHVHRFNGARRPRRAARSACGPATATWTSSVPTRTSSGSLRSPASTGSSGSSRVGARH